MKDHIFYSDCVGWPRNDVHSEGGLCDMVDAATDITRDTFVRHIDNAALADIEQNLGYAPHDPGSITMARDYHVSYHKSKLHGETVYFFKHSAIEYVFRKSQLFGEPADN